VVENGVTLTANDYLLDSPILWRGNSTTGVNWGWGRLNVLITYQAGYLNPPVIARKVASMQYSGCGRNLSRLPTR